MARFSSHTARNRRRLTMGNLYLAAAVILFAAVVFLLFRGDTSAPQEDLAGPGAADARPPQGGPAQPA